jgi:hypothetical protein
LQDLSLTGHHRLMVHLVCPHQRRWEL